ncbi:unnamed protein product [Triticum turgidum subsp. durum]|uniref:Uncharacterized protein n=1 Tax=Triticum turgidum subsp. durum TaxID=4567 RepID=A0A9R0R9W1_TRITD|nr:unnamed protein product [Triticum turgidum subsp. durum]
MNGLRKLKKGISGKRGDPHVAQHGQTPYDEWEEQQRYYSPSPLVSSSPRTPLVSASPRTPLVSPSLRTLQPSPSPRAPPVSPTGSPKTPGGSQKKPVLGKVKSKAKKWMHLLHHKKKLPSHDEMMMWTPRIGPSSDDSYGRGGQYDDDERLGTPSTALHPSSFAESEFEPEVYVQASSRQNTPAPSPTACQEQPFFKVSSRFESEMKEANEMLMESKKLRVKTSKQKTVTFAPILEYGPEIENKVWSDKERPESTTEIFRKACATVFQAALKMVSRIQDTMVAYNIDKRHMVEILVSVNRYLLLKLEPSPDDEALAEVITEAALNLLDAWTENVERPLMQRAKKISSWFLQEGRVELPPVSLSTRPCAAEGKPLLCKDGQSYLQKYVTEHYIS